MSPEELQLKDENSFYFLLKWPLFSGHVSFRGGVNPIEVPLKDLLFLHFIPVSPGVFPKRKPEAPFHLTASRADLHRSPENLRRRNAVAPAFIKACQAPMDLVIAGPSYDLPFFKRAPKMVAFLGRV